MIARGNVSKISEKGRDGRVVSREERSGKKGRNNSRGAVLAYDDVWVTAGRLDVARPHASLGQS